MGCSDIMRGYDGKCKDVERWTDFEIETHQSEEYKRYLEYHKIDVDDLHSVKCFIIWKSFGCEI
jgi:cytidylate kinase